MQKKDLDVAAQLFESANDGVDEEFWAQRFQEHIAQAMRKHSGHLRTGGSALEQALEVLRARLELHEIVADRLEGRAGRADPGLAEALRLLRQSNTQIIQEAFELQGSAVAPGVRSPRAASPNSGQSGGSVPPRNNAAPGRQSPHAGSPIGSPGLGGGQGFCGRSGGAGAFAAAARSGGRGNAAGNSSPETLMMGGDDFVQPGSPGNANWSNMTPYTETSQMTSMLGPNVPHGAAARQPKSRGYQSIHGGRSERTREIASRPAKELMLRQLREIMTSVYASKTQHDQRCMELQEPKETLEQHLYSFLSKRYGLKSVVHEWAQTIFRSIQKYAPREVDVLVFGKILQNSLSESFVTVQDTLKATVQMLLRSNLQQRHASRPQSECDALWRTRARCGVPITECEEVVRYMYNDRDCAVVLSRLHTMTEADMAENAEPDVIKYRDFLQILLTFQMQLTEGFLRDFVIVFREIDTDQDGIVNGDQLEQLVEMLATIDEETRCSPEGMNGLVEQENSCKAAMRSFNRATFSECVDICTGLVSARWAVYGAAD